MSGVIPRGVIQSGDGGEALTSQQLGPKNRGRTELSDGRQDEDKLRIDGRFIVFS